MDPRTAAYVLGQIAAHLELRGESTFKSRAYEQAATALLAVDTDDLAPLYRSGELARTRGLGPATLSVVRDLIETGESSLPRAAPRHDPVRPDRSAARPRARHGQDPQAARGARHRLHRVARGRRRATAASRSCRATGQDGGEDPQGDRAAPRRGLAAPLPAAAPRRRRACSRWCAPIPTCSRPSWPARSVGVARRWATSTSSRRAARTRQRWRRRSPTRRVCARRARRAPDPSRSPTSTAPASTSIALRAKTSRSRSGARPDRPIISTPSSARLAERGFALDGDRLRRRAPRRRADRRRSGALRARRTRLRSPELREGRGEIEFAAHGPRPGAARAWRHPRRAPLPLHLVRRQGDDRARWPTRRANAAGATSGSPTTRSPHSMPVACRASACSRSTTRSTR